MWHGVVMYGMGPSRVVWGYHVWYRTIMYGIGPSDMV